MNESKSLEQIFNFLHVMEKLKSTLRYNKTTTGRQESTAEHTWRLALMTFIIAEELELKINILHAIKIALVHDIAESITGDIDAMLILEGKVSKEEKEIQERTAMEKIKHLLPAHQSEEICNLWTEYEQATTSEARYIKALDKIETLTQLAEMGHKYYDKPAIIASYGNKAVEEFPELIGVLDLVKRKLKQEFTKGNIEWFE